MKRHSEKAIPFLCAEAKTAMPDLETVVDERELCIIYLERMSVLSCPELRDEAAPGGRAQLIALQEVLRTKVVVADVTTGLPNSRDPDALWLLRLEGKFDPLYLPHQLPLKARAAI